MPRPKLSFKDYSIAWIAPLLIEQLAAMSMLDKQHEGNFPADPGDFYQYISGEINGHNILIASFPPGTQYGGSSAAALAAQVRKCLGGSFWFGLLVGIAAGLPSPSHDIRLGDILVSLPESDKQGVIQYDMGKQHPTGFENRSQQDMTTTIVRSAIGNMIARARINGNRYEFVEDLQVREDIMDDNGKSLFRYPGQENDYLWGADDTLVQRDPRPDNLRTKVWYGNIGSGNTLMKSSKERDELQVKYNLIGLEMEAHGVMNHMPVGHIRGTCDYADKHKSKDWQGYTAAVAAAYAREILRSIDPPHGDKGPFICLRILH
jgi:nucleoside phosphorylase